ncbi:glycosyltransferase family 4 protein [Thiolapillus sp.]
MKSTVLIIGYVWPEPDSSAAGSHMLSLLRMFRANGCRVVFSSPAQRSEYMTDLDAEGVESVSILLNDSRFDSFVADLKPDYVVFDRFLMEEQFAWRVELAHPEAMRILDTEDLQCLRSARQQALREERPMQEKDLLGDLAQRECAAILRSDLSLIISSHEMELLQKTFGVNAALLHHLPFMLNLDQPHSPGKSFSGREHFVTIGNFRHAPNWDSILFLQQIWPLIHRVLPDAQLHIYGAYPPKKAMALNNQATGFLVKGRADNAHAVLADARICLSPLRFGAGIKGKLIDAMQTGTPSVTTSIGAEGMAGDLPWPGLVENTRENIAGAAIRLYQGEALWNQCQQRITPILKTHYDGEKLSRGLMRRLASIRENLEQHRLNNFTGAMLRHHSMKSTLYMSKWIEAKNALATRNPPK